MIQSILFLALGFLCACLLAVLIAPAFWRRAVRLTTRRIEATVPLTLAEIQADKDRQRAEFAVSTRRLEISLKELRERAAEQVVEIGRYREEVKRLSAGREETSQALSGLEAKGADLRTDLRRREEELGRVTTRLTEAENTLKQRAADLDRLNRQYEEASLSAVDSRAELLERVGEIEKLTGDIGRLRGARLEADRQLRTLEGELRAAHDATRAERKKTVEAEKQAERLAATLAEREDAMRRREREMADLNELLKRDSAGKGEIDLRLTSAIEDKLRLEMQVADLTMRLSKQAVSSGVGELDPAKQVPERRLDDRLVALTRENQKLRAELADRGRDTPGTHADDARLRDEIGRIAAQVIALTARLEGPDSPIHAALDAPPNEAPAQSGSLSLADRVRALRAGETASR